VAPDQTDHEVARLDRQGEQNPRRRLAVKRDQFQRGFAQAGDHLPTIAPRRAPADPPALQQRDRIAAPGRVQRRRKAGAAAADDAEIGLDGPGQCGSGREGVGGRGVIRVRDLQFAVETHQTLSSRWSRSHELMTA
jgi:hypothetical protein